MMGNISEETLVWSANEFYFKHIDIPYEHSEIVDFYLKHEQYEHRFEMLEVDNVLTSLPSINKWLKDG